MKKLDVEACPVCRGKFKKAVYWKRYCSKKCRQLAWAKRELEKMK